MIRDVVAVAGFTAFVVTGLVGALQSSRREAASGPPSGIRLAVIIGVTVSLVAGLSRRELWPFATWALIPDVARPDVRIRGLVCANPAGRTFAIDHRAWDPLTEEELLAWLAGPFQRLAPALQDTARAALLRQAEAARRRVRAGRSVAAHPSPLGPLAAASHLRHPDRWNRPDQAP